MTSMHNQPRKIRRLASKYLEKENAKRPEHLVKLERAEWPVPKTEADEKKMPLEIWRSRCFLVQVFATPTNGIERLSVNRTTLAPNGRWSDNISWDELQQIKKEVGRGEFDAVELYPPDDDVVNVANMRHLWVLSGGERLNFMWRKKPRVMPPEACS